jgi:translation initiation factor IF-3
LTISRDLRVNQMIRIPQVRVVDEEGAQLGIMPTPRALAMAQERGYDLVEVAPMASPPVARFLDFGQYKYELTKREKEAKRKQRSVTFKEVRLKPKIGGGDFDTKVRRAIEFLEDGDRIKVAVQFRGRELTHPEIGRALLERFTERIKDHGLVERMPLLEGKSMHVTVASTHRPKVHEAAHPAARGATPGATPDGAAAPAEAPPVAAVAPAEASPPAAEAPPAAAEASPPPATASSAPAPVPPVETAPAVEAPRPVQPNGQDTSAEAPAPAPQPTRSSTSTSASAAKPRARTKAATPAEGPAPATTGE